MRIEMESNATLLRRIENILQRVGIGMLVVLLTLGVLFDWIAPIWAMVSAGGFIVASFMIGMVDLYRNRPRACLDGGAPNGADPTRQ
jgi:hypothetical protein